MPLNKNAIIRYQALDRCFSNKARKFFMEDLISECCKALATVNGTSGTKGAEGVSRRQIYDDINDMELIYGVLVERPKIRHKTYYTYKYDTDTIRNSPMKQEEIDVINDALQVLKRFEGIPQLDWVNDISNRLYTTSQLGEDTSNVVSFQHNPYLKGMGKYKEAFNAIVNKQAIEITYHPFGKEQRVLTISPYHLKQYNNRWFLIGKRIDFNGLSNFAIDRIESLKESVKKYEPLDEDFSFEDHFADVIGVSVIEDAPVEKVVLAVTERDLGYVMTKPLHESQRQPQKSEDGRWIISLRVKDNYELKALLRSFGSSIEVLFPETLREEMRNEAIKTANLYKE